MSYDVEYEIPETLVWGQTIIRNDKETSAITYQENTLHLSGWLESLDENGSGCIRMGESIFLVEIETIEGYQPIPGFVRLVSLQARLHDTHL